MEENSVPVNVKVYVRGRGVHPGGDYAAGLRVVLSPAHAEGCCRCIFVLFPVVQVVSRGARTGESHTKQKLFVLEPMPTRITECKNDY